MHLRSLGVPFNLIMFLLSPIRSTRRCHCRVAQASWVTTRTTFSVTWCVGVASRQEASLSSHSLGYCANSMKSGSWTSGWNSGWVGGFGCCCGISICSLALPLSWRREACPSNWRIPDCELGALILFCLVTACGCIIFLPVLFACYCILVLHFSYKKCDCKWFWIICWNFFDFV